MNVDYRPESGLNPVRLENLTDDELSEATKTHILDMIPEVMRAEIFRGQSALLPPIQNRHDRRRDAALDRRKS